MAKTVTANYDNQQIVSFTTGKKKFQTNGKAMKTNLSVSVDGSGTETVVVSYKGSEITSFGSGTKVLSCANKLMGSDVEAEVVGGTVNWQNDYDTVQVFNSNGTAASIDAYAIFTESAILRRIDSSLTVSRSDLGDSRNGPAGAYNGAYLLIGGGQGSAGSVVKTVDAFDSSFTRRAASQMSYPALFFTGADVGDYALLAGGRQSNNNFTCNTTVNAYDKQLTKTAVNMRTAKQNVMKANIGNYVIFGGGLAELTANKQVDAFNASLTRTALTDFANAKAHPFGAASNGNTALFAGFNALIDAYNASLTHSTPTSLEDAREYIGAMNIGDYTIFAGGRINNVNQNTVSIFDAQLVRTNPVVLGAAANQLKSAKIGKYAIFGGGIPAYSPTNAIYYQ